MNRLALVILSVAIVVATLLAVLPNEAGATQAAPAITLTVNALNDSHDAAPGNTVCADAGGKCTLRAAIEEANALGGATTINFSSSYYISLTLGSLTVITNNMTIDGTGRVITVDGSLLASATPIFIIAGNHNTLSALKVANATGDGIQVGDYFASGRGSYNFVSQVVVVGSASAGIRVYGEPGGISNTISRSLLGMNTFVDTACDNLLVNLVGIYVMTDAAGTVLTTNTVACSKLDGVVIDGVGMANGTPSTLVDSNYLGTGIANQTAIGNGNNGLRDSAARNTRLISNVVGGNFQNGILLTLTQNALLLGNHVGVARDATPLPNALDGLRLDGGATNNVVGGTTEGNRNFFSRNLGNGVSLYDGTTKGNLVRGNYMTNNVKRGVYVQGATENIFGEDSGIEQLIAGNGQEGIYIGFNAAANMISHTNDVIYNVGNGIGIDNGAQFTSMNPQSVSHNGGSGVVVWNAANNVIGRTSLSPADAMVIGANGSQGVLIHSATDTEMYYTAYIGVAADGITPMGNGAEGVLIELGSTGSYLIPGYVLHNGRAGMAVTGTTSINNRMTPLNVHDNGGLALDLGNDGFTLNGTHVGPGPNNWRAYPTITAVAGNVITGTTCASCAVFIRTAVGDPSGPGGGYVSLNSAGASANGAGVWTFLNPLGRSPSEFTYLACSSPGCNFGGETSELRPRPLIYLPAILR
jgi:CSLREA domain-containing protein